MLLAIVQDLELGLVAHNDQTPFDPVADLATLVASKYLHNADFVQARIVDE